jgi:hypothetical protein
MPETVIVQGPVVTLRGPALPSPLPSAVERHITVYSVCGRMCTGSPLIAMV